MNSRFDRLINLIEPLEKDNFGEWIVDKEHKGTMDDPIHFPFPFPQFLKESLITT